MILLAEQGGESYATRLAYRNATNPQRGCMLITAEFQMYDYFMND